MNSLDGPAWLWPELLPHPPLSVLVEFGRPDRSSSPLPAPKFFGKQTIAEIVGAFNDSQSKIHVTYKELPPPSSSTEVHQTLVQQLARRNGDPDVFTQDIIWIAEFAAAKWALPIDEYFKDSAKDYFSGMVQACTWQGKLTALPWFVDSGMLYYRKDLGFNAPTSWQELIASAKQATSSGGVKFGFLWQAKQAEVLVCDLVSFIGSNGGAILQADGKTVSIADEPAVEAVQLMRDLISKEQITPADVLSWDEEPSRRPFTAGEAAFLRNWSYVWKIAQSDTESKVVDKVAVVPLPTSQTRKAQQHSAATNMVLTHRARNGKLPSSSLVGCRRQKLSCDSRPNWASVRRGRGSSIARRLPRNKRLCSRLGMCSSERFRVR